MHAHVQSRHRIGVAAFTLHHSRIRGMRISFFIGVAAGASQASVHARLKGGAFLVVTGETLGTLPRAISQSIKGKG
jgi:hypothetical protein